MSRNAKFESTMQVHNASFKKPLSKRILNALNRDKYLYLLILPGFLYFLIFCYVPMYGASIAFRNFQPGQSIMESPWVGLKWFSQFFNGLFFTRLLRNTFLVSLYSLLWGFPIPILFSLLLNELPDGLYKRLTQTISYLPHFISVVVLVSFINQLFGAEGPVNNLLFNLTGQTHTFVGSTKWFRTLYVGSGIWQSFGWSSIIYLAAIAGIDPQLYEAAKIDGASRFRQMLNITLPGIMPSAIIMLILRMGGLLSVGFEKIILMYGPSTYEVADVISTYVYRMGLIDMRYSFASAVDIFNAIVNMILLLTFNALSRRMSEVSLW